MFTNPLRVRIFPLLYAIPVKTMLGRGKVTCSERVNSLKYETLLLMLPLMLRRARSLSLARAELS